MKRIVTTMSMIACLSAGAAFSSQGAVLAAAEGASQQGYSLAEKMSQALVNTMIGMATVFIILILISYIIGCFRYIHKFEEYLAQRKAAKQARKAQARNGLAAAAEEKPVAAAQPQESQELVDDLELVAVITAAIAASENTSADSLIVRSIKRAPSSKWKKA